MHLSKEEADIARQWFNSIQDAGHFPLETDDFKLARRLYNACNMRVPSYLNRGAISCADTQKKSEETGVIKEFPDIKEVDYPEQQELYERVIALIHEYDDDISFPAAIGIIELVKYELMRVE